MGQTTEIEREMHMDSEREGEVGGGPSSEAGADEGRVVFVC